MSLPTTARQTPTGIKLRNGFSSKIAFERAPSVSLWEKTVKPPGLDGGAPIETSTMHNVTVRTMSPRSLITVGETSGKCAYDPNVYNQILSLINEPGGITIHWADGSTLDFYGFLQKFEPDALEEGKQPEADVTIVSTNEDPVTGAEVLPALTSVAGT